MQIFLVWVERSKDSTAEAKRKGKGRGFNDAPKHLPTDAGEKWTESDLNWLAPEERAEADAHIAALRAQGEGVAKTSRG